MKSVSVERFFLFYWGLNYAIFYFAAHWTAEYAVRLRLAMGAALMAAYLTGEYIFFGGALLVGRFFVTLLAVAAAFPNVGQGGRLRLLLIINLLAIVISGIIYNFAVDIALISIIFVMVGAGSLFIFILLPFCRGVKARQELCDVEIGCGEKSVTVRAFLDTGNLLYTPSGLLPVIVADYKAVLPLFDEAARRYLMSVPPKNWLENLPKCADEKWKSALIFVRASSVGGSNLLLAVKSDRIIVHRGGKSWRFRGAVALSELKNQPYQVLLHHDFQK
jgi:sigma-E processing peptidase SpoIIGA